MILVYIKINGRLSSQICICIVRDSNSYIQEVEKVCCAYEILRKQKKEGKKERRCNQAEILTNKRALDCMISVLSLFSYYAFSILPVNFKLTEFYTNH